jgi:GcrA cell cycle regulator
MTGERGFWTDETEARLARLWNEGRSSAEIARLMKTTKNAVVGRVHRLGLERRPSPIKRPEAGSRPRALPRAPAQPLAAGARTLPPLPSEMS